MERPDIFERLEGLNVSMLMIAWIVWRGRGLFSGCVHPAESFAEEEEEGRLRPSDHFLSAGPALTWLISISLCSEAAAVGSCFTSRCSQAVAPWGPPPPPAPRQGSARVLKRFCQDLDLRAGIGGVPGPVRRAHSH